MRTVKITGDVAMHIIQEGAYTGVLLAGPGIHGTVGASQISSCDVWYLNRLLVRPDGARGCGYGTILLQQLQQELAEIGCKRLIVEPGGYGSDPERLRLFYKRNGFVDQKDGSMVWSPVVKERASG